MSGAHSVGLRNTDIGAKWQLRRTDTANGSSNEMTMTAMPVEYLGVPRYGMSDGVNMVVLDPATFNAIATLRDSKELTTSTPDVGTFSWPLWVGKTWRTSYTYRDLVRARTFSPVVYDQRVAAYEDVTVPAGTFKAFRV